MIKEPYNGHRAEISSDTQVSFGEGCGGESPTSTLYLGWEETEPPSNRDSSRPGLVSARAQRGATRQAHEYDSALKVLCTCGPSFKSGSLSTSLGLYQRRTTRQAHEYDSALKALATWLWTLLQIGIALDQSWSLPAENFKAGARV